MNCNSLVELSASAGLGGGDEAYYTYVEEADNSDESGPTKIALLFRNVLIETYGNQRRYPLFLHGYSKERIGYFHSALVVSNHDNLGFLSDILD
jgi:hypothetical protein